jgi:cobalt transporter subunit CbtA
MSLTAMAEAFRRLMTVVLVAGAGAGLLLAALQFVTVIPLIHRAEAYEHSQQRHAAPAAHADQGWSPAEGIERSVYTVLGTVLTGIAFAALLFGAASLLGLDLDRRQGVWLGAAGFVCCALAPSLGLPPRPPGAPGAELHAAQAWWCATALATAFGLWASAHAGGRWTWRAAGVACLLAPHLLGAPRPTGSGPVPSDLIRQFAVVSVATQAVFWLLLGGFGSYLYMKVGASSRS